MSDFSSRPEDTSPQGFDDSETLAEQLLDGDLDGEYTDDSLGQGKDAGLPNSVAFGILGIFLTSLAFGGYQYVFASNSQTPSLSTLLGYSEPAPSCAQRAALAAQSSCSSQGTCSSSSAQSTCSSQSTCSMQTACSSAGCSAGSCSKSVAGVESCSAQAGSCSACSGESALSPCQMAALAAQENIDLDNGVVLLAPPVSADQPAADQENEAEVSSESTFDAAADEPVQEAAAETAETLVGEPVSGE